MSAELVTGDVWGRLRKAHRKTRRQASVAVAYFGKGAAKLLSLKKGDQLVVDASENAVKSGQTYPEDLLTLLKKRSAGIQRLQSSRHGLCFWKYGVHWSPRTSFR